MKEEDKLFRKIGTDNPFSVPDNYFETMTSKLMDNLPEKEPCIVEMKETSRWQRLKPLLYMAAMFVGAALIIKVADFDSDKASSAGRSAQTEMADADQEGDRYFNEMAEGSMMDDYSLYVYLTSNTTE
jgi:hypothetical protein